MVARINAGSDFTILPSLYEPYGLTQLECTKLASIPIVHGVDGLKSTISDPVHNGKEWFKSRVAGKPERVWQYGQTGVMIEPFDVSTYRKGVTHINADKPVLSIEQAAMDDAQKKFRSALDRALDLAGDKQKAFEVREAGMKYVEENHRWEPIVDRYVDAIDLAVADHNGTGKTLAFA